jgi:hypothetical protein
MKERTIKANLRKSLREQGVYIQDMSSIATNGTPDLWLSDKGGDLWLEVKVNVKTIGGILPSLSPLQQLWLNNQHDLGRSVCVYVATNLREGILYCNGEWNSKKNDRLPWDEVIKELLKKIK